MSKAQSIGFLLSQVRASGVALAGGEVEFFAAGTSTPKLIWLDRNKAVEAANPYTLDANGTAQLFADGIYRVVIRDSTGAEKYDRDGLSFRDASSNVYDVADYASLAAAVASIGATPATLQFANDVTVSANLVIPSTLELMPLNGAKINHTTYTITYAGSTARWPTAQIFNGTGAISGIGFGRAEWLGAKADGATDSTIPLTRATSYFTEVGLLRGTYLTGGWDVSGHGKRIFGVSAAPTGLQSPNESTIIKAIGSQTYVFKALGFNHTFERITFNGADATTTVVEMPITELGIKFKKCVFEHTTVNTGILVRVDTTNGGLSASIQGDSNLFEDCEFWQNYLSGVEHNGVGLSIIGSNSFLNHISRCKFWFCSTPIKISFGAGAWIDDVQFHDWTVAAIVIDGNFQTTIIEKCYTESSTGLNFLNMNDLAVIGTATLTIRNNIINAVNNLSLIPKQPIIMEGNAFQGLTYINDPGVADFPKVLSIGNSWQDGGSFTGAMATSVVRINDTTNSGATAYNTYPAETTGTWTPVLTCATPGDLAVTPAVQVGTYTRQGNIVTASFVLTTSAFTHTTASGNLQITGLPFTSSATANSTSFGALVFSGITKEGATNIVTRVLPSTSYISFGASGSGISNSSVTITDLPSAGTVLLQGTVTYSIQ